MEFRGKASAAVSSKQLTLVEHSLCVRPQRPQGSVGNEDRNHSFFFYVLAWMQGVPSEQAHKLQDLVECTAFRNKTHGHFSESV